MMEDIYGTVTDAIPTWLLVLLFLILLVYIYGTWRFDQFEARGIPGPRPWPFVGNLVGMFRMGITEFDRHCLDTYGNIVGHFMSAPSIIVGDVDMLKQILIKEWACFINKSKSKITGYPLDKSLIALKGEHWKHTRRVLSPTFSSGKLKQMTDLIQVCAGNLASHLEDLQKGDGEFECKELFSRYTMDVITSTAFGIQVNSHEEEENEFILMAKKILKRRLFNKAVFIVVFFPSLLPLLKRYRMSMLDQEATDFMVKVVKQALAERREHKSDRRDFLQLMLEAKIDDDDNDAEEKLDMAPEAGEYGKWSKTGLTEEEILGQSLIFFVAGYVTTSHALSFLCYLLAINPDCQQRLLVEVTSVLGEEEPNYENVSQMPYLDMCLNEAMRLYPPVPRVDRVASYDIIINGMFIAKDTSISVPIGALQRDPIVYPEPNKFDPERFTPEAKANRNPMYFMPFGAGPRNCIGKRLALLQAKIAAAYVFQRYKLTTCDKSPHDTSGEPLQMAMSTQFPKGGLWLKAERRQQ